MSPIFDMRKARKAASANSLGQSTSCTAYVLLPHSLHSYTPVENYASGFPFVVPSPRLLASWHMQYSLIWHKCPGSKPFCSGLRDGPDQPRGEPELAAWLAHAGYVDTYTCTISNFLPNHAMW